MHTYIDLYFTPDGVSPLEIADRLRRHAELTFVVGPHDLVFEWQTVDEFRERLGKVHTALQGTGVSYRVQSSGDDSFVQPAAWPPSLQSEPQQHPGYPGPP
ncbi:MAG: hypothetical protein L3K06_01585 [Thermoplasmata archaeon]|nr:hypothetical protein [Thermoplasmata archaeon]MCI4354040.1 hypothetical protein [Thermoplasmata archaeon]